MNTTRTKVFLTAGRNVSWAIEDDLNNTRLALKDIVEFTNIENSSVIHTTYIDALNQISAQNLNGKKVICHMIGEPLRYLKTIEYRKLMNKVRLWITHSVQANNQLDSIGINSKLIPYTVNTDQFRPLNNKNFLMDKYKIPKDRFIVGNFHRDTEGNDLRTPKYVKGPDIFLEIIKNIPNVHVVLAGPRRFWIRNKLEHYNIPYTFIGKIVNHDDISINIMNKDVINELYNLLDLYIVSSRSEGGPRTILEASAAKCNIISTNVGIATDIIDKRCIYHDLSEALNIVKCGFKKGIVNDIVETNYNNSVNNYNIYSIIPLLRELYE